MSEEISTEELEKKVELTEEEKVEQRAKQFTYGMNTFKQMSSNLKAGSLKRVLDGVLEFPLGKTPKLLKHEERLLFSLFLEIFDNKLDVLGDLAKKSKGVEEDGGKEE